MPCTPKVQVVDMYYSKEIFAWTERIKLREMILATQICTRGEWMKSWEPRIFNNRYNWAVCTATLWALCSQSLQSITISQYGVHVSSAAFGFDDAFIDKFLTRIRQVQESKREHLNAMAKLRNVVVYIGNSISTAIPTVAKSRLSSESLQSRTSRQTILVVIAHMNGLNRRADIMRNT
jgi:hypothetical protein